MKLTFHGAKVSESFSFWIICMVYPILWEFQFLTITFTPIPPFNLNSGFWVSGTPSTACKQSFPLLLFNGRGKIPQKSNLGWCFKLSHTLDSRLSGVDCCKPIDNCEGHVVLKAMGVSFNCDLNYRIILKNIFPQANHTLCFCSLNWPKGHYTWSSGGQHVTSNRTYHNFLGLNPPFTPRWEGWEWEEGACSGGLIVMRHCEVLDN